MNLLGIDPGGTTGFCLWDCEKRTYALQQKLTLVDGFGSHGVEPWGGIETFRLVTSYWVNQVRPITILIEKFEFRKDDQHRDKIDYTPAELNGVMKSLYLERWQNNLDVHLLTQQASQVMDFWTNDKLRRLGLWKGTDNRHAMDALRHVLYYRTFVLNDKTELLKLR